MKLSDKYHKIMSIYKRDTDGKFIHGQWATDEIELLKDIQWQFTEKVDGTNIRIAWDGKETVYAGRSDNAQIPAPLIQKLDTHFKTFEARKLLQDAFGTDEVSVVLYGEGYGAKIQKGGGNYNPEGSDFVLFDVKIDGLYLSRENVNDVAKKLEIDSVPVLGRGTLADAIEIVKKGLTSKWGDFIAEGIVARPYGVDLFTRRGDRVITKIKHKDFL